MSIKLYKSPQFSVHRSRTTRKNNDSKLTFFDFSEPNHRYSSSVMKELVSNHKTILKSGIKRKKKSHIVLYSGLPMPMASAFPSDQKVNILM